MKICYIGNTGPHIEKFVKSFRNRDHEIHLITWDESKNWENINVHYLGGNHSYFNKWFMPLAIWKVRKLVKKIQPDILHTHYIFPNTYYGCLTGFHSHITSTWGSDILPIPEKTKSIKNHKYDFQNLKLKKMKYSSSCHMGFQFFQGGLI